MIIILLLFLPVPRVLSETQTMKSDWRWFLCFFLSHPMEIKVLHAESPELIWRMGQCCSSFADMMGLFPSVFPHSVGPLAMDHSTWHLTGLQTQHFTLFKWQHQPWTLHEGFSGFHFNQAPPHSWKIDSYSKRNKRFICQMPNGTIQPMFQFNKTLQ